MLGGAGIVQVNVVAEDQAKFVLGLLVIVFALPERVSSPSKPTRPMAEGEVCLFMPHRIAICPAVNRGLRLEGAVCWLV